MNEKNHNTKRLVLLYGFLFGYVLSFVFSGRVYVQVALFCGRLQDNTTLLAMLFHMLGLAIAGIVLKQNQTIQKVMGYCIAGCMIFTLCYLLPFEIISLIAYCLVAFLSGIAVACWGLYFKECIETKERMKSMAETLILSNILMIAAGLIAIYVHPLIGLAITIFYLIVAVVIKTKIKFEEIHAEKDEKMKAMLNHALILLFIFVVVITIDSGLMYGVFNQAYDAYEWLTSWYWAIPYIAVLAVMRILVKQNNGTGIIQIAIAMIVMGFTLFYYISILAFHYVLIDSLLLGASGILDLFWSSIVGESLEYSNTPVRVISIGWSANVFGVLIGSFISVIILACNISKASMTIFALIIAFVSLLILPMLLTRVRALFKNHFYVSTFVGLPEDEQKEATKICEPVEKLTVRETELLELVLKGYTNQDIAKDLSISENTVKTHVRKILAKYQVDNRVQLISLILHRHLIILHSNFRQNMIRLLLLPMEL